MAIKKLLQITDFENVAKIKGILSESPTHALSQT